MTTPNETIPTVKVAKRRGRVSDDGIITLSTGVRVKIKPVSAALIAQVTNQIDPPKVPTFFNEDRNREEENPAHPDYIAKLDQWEMKRQLESMNAMAMFGVELVDPIPTDEEDSWARKLELLNIKFDPADPVEREYCYKRYVALAGPDYVLLGRMSGLSEEAIAEAAASFPSDA